MRGGVGEVRGGVGEVRGGWEVRCEWISVCS